MVPEVAEEIRRKITTDYTEKYKIKAKIKIYHGERGEHGEKIKESSRQARKVHREKTREN